MIEHILRLITINEAVVDTSEIDSVKPRRSSLSRQATWSHQISLYRGPLASHGESKARTITAEPPASRPAPPLPFLLRSHSMPSLPPAPSVPPTHTASEASYSAPGDHVRRLPKP